jgi:hypothetical protein
MQFYKPFQKSGGVKNTGCRTNTLTCSILNNVASAIAVSSAGQSGHLTIGGRDESICTKKKNTESPNIDHILR